MYQKYTTIGFIIYSRATKEADRTYYLYTEDFGMVQAHAVSVRTSKSKLRPHLNIGVPIFFTLLRSRNGWKITEAVESGAKLSSGGAEYKIFIQIISVLKSLVHGEEKNESLYKSLNNFYLALLEQNNETNLNGIEMLAMLSVLSSLGYGVESDLIEYGKGVYDYASIKYVNENKTEIIKAINKSLKETGF